MAALPTPSREDRQNLTQWCRDLEATVPERVTVEQLREIFQVAIAGFLEAHGIVEGAVIQLPFEAGGELITCTVGKLHFSKAYGPAKLTLRPEGRRAKLYNAYAIACDIRRVVVVSRPPTT